ncbi:MAG: TraR/DksA family transcriptional regulator, partial [Planctomycetes bacterium]|nr:TraR/DksA family transcriptional regulator [Planctomycetota bacterium]
RLYDRRERLTETIRRRLRERDDSGGYRLPDVIDIAALASTQQLGMLVERAELGELQQIDDAISRIDSGSYGICKECGEAIRKDRLKALPYATLCLKCKEIEEEYEVVKQEATELESFSEADLKENETKVRPVMKKLKKGKYSHN